MDKIINDINNYSSKSTIEEVYREQMLELLKEKKLLAFSRESEKAHFTASAWILNPNSDKVLLLFHNKLQKWLQPGGHADGNSDLKQVALKEAEEESGLKDLNLINDNIFDIDIHKIPARNKEVEHFHYDVRYIFQTRNPESVTINHESKAYNWVHINDLINTINNDSIVRMAIKTKDLLQNGKLNFNIRS